MTPATMTMEEAMALARHVQAVTDSLGAVPIVRDDGLVGYRCDCHEGWLWRTLSALLHNHGAEDHVVAVVRRREAMWPSRARRLAKAVRPPARLM